MSILLESRLAFCDLLSVGPCKTEASQNAGPSTHVWSGLFVLGICAEFTLPVKAHGELFYSL
jgi:hypothetical protein